MDKTMIGKLQKAGVSADVILSLVMDDDQPSEQPAEQPAEQPETKPAAQPETRPAATNPDPVLAAIEKLTGAIQASNIINTGREKVPALTTDQILADLLAGPKPEGGK